MVEQRIARIRLPGDAGAAGLEQRLVQRLGRLGFQPMALEMAIFCRIDCRHDPASISHPFIER